MVFNNRRILFAAVCLAVGVSASAYPFIGIRKNVRVGMHWAKLNGDFPLGQEALKPTVFGGGLEIGLLGTLAVEGDLLYATKGTHYSSGPESGDMTLRYLSIPVVVKYKFFPVLLHPYVFGGMAFNTLLSAKDNGVDIKGDLESGERSLIAGVGVEAALLGKGIFVEACVDLGQSRIVKNSDIPVLVDGIRTRTSRISVGLLF